MKDIDDDDGMILDWIDFRCYEIWLTEMVVTFLMNILMAVL